VIEPNLRYSQWAGRVIHLALESAVS
jgi:hypothetical protein